MCGHSKRAFWDSRELCLPSLKGRQHQLSHGKLEYEKGLPVSTLETYVVCSHSSFSSFDICKRSSWFQAYVLSVTVQTYALCCCLNWPIIPPWATPRNIFEQRCPLEYTLGLIAFITLFCRELVFLVSPIIGLEACLSAAALSLSFQG